MSPLRFKDDHRKRQDRVYGRQKTGKWLLEPPLFKEWRDGELPMLWYTGNRVYSALSSQEYENLTVPQPEPGRVF